MEYYARKHSSLSDKEAALCGPVLAKIETDHGKLTPRLVVADASDPRSPLHDQFEWNDTEAAIKYREDQARRLIRNIMVRVTVDDKKLTSRKLVADHVDTAVSLAEECFGAHVKLEKSILEREEDAVVLIEAHTSGESEAVRQQYHQYVARAVERIPFPERSRISLVYYRE